MTFPAARAALMAAAQAAIGFTGGLDASRMAFGRDFSGTLFKA